MQQEYGTLLRDYTKPNMELIGSILNKSNLNGGGRGRATTASFGSLLSRNDGNNANNNRPLSIIGDVINHGKQDLWNPTRSIHYHATLQKGEPTLEAQLGRVLMKSIVATNGIFDPKHFQQAYIDFMMTPNSHNDTYASTCHRMFFANYVFKKLPPDQCPDNDQHNVDTIDGLVLPTIVALATGCRTGDATQVASASAACAAVTRRSQILERVAGIWGTFVATAVLEPNDANVMAQLTTMAQPLIGRRPNLHSQDQLTACYLQQSLPPLIDMVARYMPSSSQQKPTSIVWDALLNNANIGGENVHRGSILGAVLGARVGRSNLLPNQMMTGLYPHEQIAKEIDDFVQVVLYTDHQT